MAIRVLTGSFPLATGTVTGDGDATLTSRSSLTILPEDAIQTTTLTVSLDTSHPTGQFIDGTWFIKSTQAGKITAYSPDCSVVNGAIRNGAGVDPWSTTGQGFDQFLATSSNSGIAATNVAYDSALNIAPGSGSDQMTWEIGDYKCFVISVRRASVTNDANWTTIERYVRIYIVPFTPYADEYRPAPYWNTLGPRGAVPRPRYRRASVNTNAIRGSGSGITFPASWTYTTADLIAAIPPDLGFWGRSSNNHRRFRQHDGMYQGAMANYAARIPDQSGPLIAQIHNAAISSSERQQLIDYVVTKGIDMEGAVACGFTGLGTNGLATADLGGRGPGAGQNADYESWIYATAFLFNDAKILEAANKIGSTRSTPMFWAAPAFEGAATLKPSGGGNTHNTQTFFSEHIGYPFTIPDEFCSDFDTRYGVEAMWTNAYETLAIALFVNGPSGLSDGIEAVLRGGALDSTNAYAAHVAALGEYRKWTEWPVASNALDSAWRDFYDFVWALDGYTQPDLPAVQLPLGGGSGPGSDFMGTGGTGEITWDVSGQLHATQADRVDFRWGHDGVQFSEHTNVGVTSDTVTQSIAVGAGRTVYAGLRLFKTSTGAGPWSPHFPTVIGAAERGVFTVPGTPSNSAQSVVVNPQIHVRRYPSWDQTLGAYVPASGTLAANQIELACGAGIWNGYPFDPVTHQTVELYRDGVATGITTKTYTRKRLDAGTDLFWRVTTDNGVGSPTVIDTAAVTCPALNTIPATTLFDTEFGWDAVIDYEESVANAVLDDATCEFDPTYVQTMADDEGALATSAGTLFCDTLGSFPKVHIPPHNPALANKTYDVEIEAIIQSSGFEQSVDVVNGVNGSSLIGGAVTEAAFSDVTAKLMTITATIVTGGTPPTLYVRLANNAGTAGGGSLPRLSKIVIKEQV